MLFPRSICFLSFHSTDQSKHEFQGAKKREYIKAQALIEKFIGNACPSYLSETREVLLRLTFVLLGRKESSLEIRVQQQVNSHKMKENVVFCLPAYSC